MRFLVVGMGSIGLRHARNLQRMGHEVVAYDTYVDVPDFPFVNHFPEPGENFDAWIICTPPNFHLSHMEDALLRGYNVFVEKPIADRPSEKLESLVKMAHDKHLIIYPGHCLRHHPKIKELHRMITEGELGKIYGFRFEYGYDLKQWRPGTDYTKNYNARYGIVVESVHELDLIRWMFGEPVEVMSLQSKVSDLQLDARAADTCETIMGFPGGLLGSLHFDMVQKNYLRRYRVWGSDGWVEFEIVQGKQLAQMYVDQMNNFIWSIRREEPQVVTAEDAIRAVELMEICDEDGVVC